MSVDPCAGLPDVTDALRAQLDLIWSYADQHVLPQVHEELTLWRPSENSVGMRRHQGSWSAEMPDEAAGPIPEPTVGWLLWHIEWWWTNAARATRGEACLGPHEQGWSGSAQGVQSAKDTWDRLLRVTPGDATVTGLMPSDEPFWYVAGWVNFELSKNISEIGQLILRHRNDN